MLLFKFFGVGNSRFLEVQQFAERLDDSSALRDLHFLLVYGGRRNTEFWFFVVFAQAEQ